MSFFYYLVLFSLTILLIKYVLFWTYLWQLKEYRLDRMRDFLSSPEGRRLWFSKNYLVKIGLIVLSLILLFLLFILPSYGVAISFSVFLFGLIIAILIIFEAIWFILKIFQKKIVLPTWTGRAKLTVFLSCLFILSILIFPISQYPNIPISQFFFLTLILITFAPIIISLAIIITMPFAAIVKYHICCQAKRKRQQFKNLIVIGITGSYGKTSVKEFIAQILSLRFKVLKTEKNINTEIGIAMTILKKLRPEHQIFVCEMGAYKKGEIKRSGQIARPQIAVITGLCQQHLSLFGSLENIIATKSEILSYLPKDGVVFLNYDSELVHQFKVPSDCQKITYGLSSADVDISARQAKGEWKLEIKKLCSPRSRNWEIGKLGNLPSKAGLEIRNLKLEVSILGKHNVLNLLPAIVIALSLGMKKEEIEQAVKKIKPPDGTMRLIKKNNLILIDDTYNANPAGVKAAIETLSDYNNAGARHCLVPTVKILILDDILELGPAARSIHQQIGEQIAKMQLAKLILVGKNYAGLIKKILLQAGFKPEQVIMSQSGLRTTDIINGDQPAVILFEGRRAKEILEKFTLN